MKALLFFIFIIIVFVAIKYTLKRINIIRAENTSEEDDQQPKQPPKKMVSCHKCGVHLAQDKALLITNNSHDNTTKEPSYACCKEHV